MPPLTPLTTPPASTVATDVLLLLHVPPLTVLLYVAVVPVHILVAPLSVPAPDVAMTVMLPPVLTVPQLLLTT